VFGSISNIRDGVSSNYHLLFDLVMQPSYLRNPFYSYNTRYLSYNYSKLSLASSFKKRAQRFTTLSHSLSRYPALKGAESRAQLDSLSYELLVDGCIAPDQLPDGLGTRISIRLEVLSLGPLIGHFHEDGSREVAVNTTANVTLHQQTASECLNTSYFQRIERRNSGIYHDILQEYLTGVLGRYI